MSRTKKKKKQQTELFVYSYSMMRQSHDLKAAALIIEGFLQHYDGPFHLCRCLPFDGSSKWLSVKRMELTRLCFICVKVRRELTASVKKKIKMSNYFRAPQKFKVEIFIANASISTWTYCCCAEKGPHQFNQKFLLNLDPVWDLL